MRIGVASLKLKYRFIKSGMILIRLSKKKPRQSIDSQSRDVTSYYQDSRNGSWATMNMNHGWP